MNTALVLAYRGSDYHGWQRQPDGMTVQELLERAVSETCGLRGVYVSGCGRTDAGVHAAYYVCNFKGEQHIPADRLPLALNARLPDAVAVKKAVCVEEDFDARFSCQWKEYTYLIHNSRLRDPFLTERACYYPQHLDEGRMAEAAALFVGKQDFAAVRNLGTPVKSTVRTVYRCEVDRRGDRVRVRVAADGFLYNMVRAIVGTLMWAGIGKLSCGDIRAALDRGDREAAGPTAPACGLYMTALRYGIPSLDGAADVF